MKFFKVGKDEGPQSTVTGYWLAEIKRLFSVVLLKFGHGSRDEFHSHAFNSVNWVLKGKVVEENLDGSFNTYLPSWRPVITRRSTFHRVVSDGTTWVFSLRGPWAKTWMEYSPVKDQYTTLTNHRVKV
jgi:hypothetical protein